jgi:hypothetical protein
MSEFVHLQSVLLLSTLSVLIIKSNRLRMKITFINAPSLIYLNFPESYTSFLKCMSNYRGELGLESVVQLIGRYEIPGRMNEIG